MKINALISFFRILNKDLQFRFVIYGFLTFISLILEFLSVIIIIPLIENITGGDSVYNAKIQSFLSIEEDQYIYFLLLVLFTLYLIKTLYSLFLAKKQNDYTAHVISYVSSKVYKNYLKQPYIFHIENSSTKLMNVLTKDNSNLMALLNSVIFLISEVLLVFILISIIISINFKVAVLAITLLFLLSFFLIKNLKNTINNVGYEKRESEEKILKILLETFSGIKNIIYLNAFNKFEKYYNKEAVKTYFLISKHVFYSSLPRIIIEFVVISIIVLTLYFLHTNDYNSSEIITLIGTFVAISFKLIPSFGKITNAFQSFNYYEASLIQFNKDIRLKNTEDRKSIKLENYLSLEAFSFKYGSEYILKKNNLKIKRGDKIIISGESGSGKSTLIEIICGFKSINEGKVIIDGKKVENNKVNIEYSYVDQNPFVFEESILYNITLENDVRSIDIIKFNEILKMCLLDKLVLGLKNTINTTVKELGSNLSGGQIQRITIARALYNNSDLIILDEATSSLDEENADLFLKSLIQRKESTILYISHNKNHAKYFDRIITIKNKKLIIKNLI